MFELPSKVCGKCGSTDFCQSKRPRCRPCKAQSRKRNGAKRREYTRQWALKNPEKIAAYKATTRFKELKREADRRYAKRRSKEAKERADERIRQWALKNPGKRAANEAKRRAKIVSSTPSWADLKAIQAFYEACPKGYEVDHIIPLQGKLVSGLHVLENLQYLTEDENRRKSNKFNLSEYNDRHSG